MINIIKEILFLMVIFCTSTVNAITGFAGILLAMPPAILLIGIDEAKTMLNIIAIFAGLLIAWQNHTWINKKELIKILFFMFTGMLIGMKLYELLPLELMLTAYAVLIICIAVKGLFIKRSFRLSDMFMLVLLLIAGIIHGMFLSGGSLLVVYASKKLKCKNEFRATLAPMWISTSLFMLFDHINHGYITKKVLILLSLTIIPVILGTRFGNKLHRKIDQALFMKFTYILLGISGLLIFLK